MNTVPLRKSPFFPFPNFPGENSRRRGDNFECNNTPIFSFVFSNYLPDILMTKSAYFTGSGVFHFLCPPLSFVFCVLVLGGVDMGVVAV